MEDLPLSYHDYFTHQPVPLEPLHGFRRRSGRVAGALLARALGVERERRRLRSCLLDGRPPGRLLEVGCGDGRGLAGLRALGWEVEGQEADPVAAERARATHGLRVGVGRLRADMFNDRCFDAVTLVHVLEHDPEPLRLLAEAGRLVRPGGVLIVITPNVESLGHRIFGAHWPGLDPPRHLFVFSPAALRHAAAAAGLRGASVWTSAANAERHARDAWALRRRSRGSNRVHTSLAEALLSHAFQIVASGVHRARRESGEELVLEAMR